MLNSRYLIINLHSLMARLMGVIVTLDLGANTGSDGSWTSPIPSRVGRRQEESRRRPAYQFQSDLA